MAVITAEALFGKLNKLAYRSIESATNFCKLRGNPQVELVHWINQILQLQDSDLRRILQHFGCDASRVAEGLTAALENCRAVRGDRPFSEDLGEATQQGWLYATLRFGESQVRTGYLLIGMLNSRQLKHALVRISQEFDKIKLEALTDNFAQIVAGSPEDGLAASDVSSSARPVAPGEASGAMPAAQLGKQEALNNSPSISPSRRAKARSIPSSGATRKFDRSSTS